MPNITETQYAIIATSTLPVALTAMHATHIWSTPTASRHSAQAATGITRRGLRRTTFTASSISTFDPPSSLPANRPSSFCTCRRRGPADVSAGWRTRIATMSTTNLAVSRASTAHPARTSGLVKRPAAATTARAAARTMTNASSPNACASR